VLVSGEGWALSGGMDLQENAISVGRRKWDGYGVVVHQVLNRRYRFYHLQHGYWVCSVASWNATRYRIHVGSSPQARMKKQRYRVERGRK
jgi:hypothetical protein